VTAASKIADALAGQPLPVRMPGASAGVLPCVQLVPTSSEWAPGRIAIQHGYEVHVIVGRGNDPELLSRLEAHTDDVAAVLAGTQFLIDDRIGYESGQSEDVQTLARVFTVYATGRTLC